jgi:hypothetical protein
VFGDVIKAILEVPVGNWKGAWTDLGAALRTAWNAYWRIVGDALAAIGALIVLDWAAIAGALVGPRAAIGALLADAWSGIVDDAGAGPSAMRSCTRCGSRADSYRRSSAVREGAGARGLCPCAHHHPRWAG